ncbi:hypothetical protein [Dactylosporangium darangshiense]|uniref:hypothetical protein n=1 Tax=Dactylosporangium darangshiense TaxID=579108 RepID=UPI0031E57F1F
MAFKTPKDRLTLVQQQLNQAHNGVRAIADRGNALLKMTFRALRNVSLSLADRENRCRSARPAPPRPRPHTMKPSVIKPLLGMAHWSVCGFDVPRSVLLHRSPLADHLFM